MMVLLHYISRILVFPISLLVCHEIYSQTDRYFPDSIINFKYIDDDLVERKFVFETASKNDSIFELTLTSFFPNQVIKDSLTLLLRGDSVFLLSENLRLFFFTFLDGTTADQDDHILLKNANLFYPIGNLATVNSMGNNLFRIRLIRSGSYTTSIDGFFNELVVEKNKGVVAVSYFDGEASHFMNGYTDE